MRLLYVWLAAFLTFFAGCSNSVSDGWLVENLLGEDSLAGMFRVNASGTAILMGTTDTLAPLRDRTQMWVTFTYDFSIGAHEVTYGDIMSVAKKVSFPKESRLAGISAPDSLNYPITNVTYYDAVLFANARSKSENKDTAYTYRSLSFDSEGNCNEMEGLVFHLDVDAYRLPTEAEWMLVAAKAWKPWISWHSGNSGYRTHEVCTAEDSTGKSASDLQRYEVPCDFVGNVAEWSNDWLSMLMETSVTNFVGAISGGNMGERLHKGGSYRNALTQMQAHSRSDVYVVTSASKADYLGFRLAYGSIPDAEWLEYSGKVSSTRSVPETNAKTLRNIMGTFRSKLVFRNDVTGNISYIDYSDVELSVKEIRDTLDSYHPDISPDGVHVAFCTGLEGVDSKSAVYVRNLDVDGSNLVKLDVPSAAIPRWRVLGPGDTVIVYVTSAANNKEDAEFMAMETWQVPFRAGKFGTPEKLFDGAYHDGISSDNSLAVSGARLLRARVSNSKIKVVYDTVWYNGEQACNASLDPDTKRTLFLDFGGDTGREFAGVEYGVHEMLLVADSTGELVRAVPAPAGKSFDHSEWVKDAGSDWAVATLVSERGSHSNIVLVNVADSSVLELVEGDDLWHPCLWVDPQSHVAHSSSLNADSAGAYLVRSEWGEFMLRCKMELLWREYAKSNVVVVGSSRPLSSIAPQAFSLSNNVVNLAQTPNSIFLSRDLLHRYVFDQFKRLEFVVVSLDIDFWWKLDEGEDNFFASDYKSIPGYVYDENHGYWKDGVPEDMYYFVHNQLNSQESMVFMNDNGYYDRECAFWGNTNPEIDMDSTLFDKHPEYLRNSMAALEQIVSEAAEYGVTVVGVVFPMSPYYRKTGAFGRYGMRRSVADSLLKEISALHKRYENFVLMDENKMGRHDYTDYHAYDYDHLCVLGAIRMSGRLDSLLVKLRSEKRQ